LICRTRRNGFIDHLAHGLEIDAHFLENIHGATLAERGDGEEMWHGANEVWLRSSASLERW